MATSPNAELFQFKGSGTLGVVHTETPLVSLVAPYGLAIVVTFVLQAYTDPEVNWRLKEGLERDFAALGSGIYRRPGNAIGSRYRNRLSIRAIGALEAILFFALWVNGAYVGFWGSPIIQDPDLNGSLPPVFAFANLSLLIYSAVVVLAAGKELLQAGNGRSGKYSVAAEVPA